MYALQFKFICTVLLIVAYLRPNDAVAAGRSRRRFGQAKTKVAEDESAAKATTDQSIAASTKSGSNKYRKDGAYSSAGNDYIYNTADINLVQPESKPLQSGTKIRAKYSSSITIPYNALEDTETAEEYVAKAVGMYGARFRQPIHVSYEPQTTPAEEFKYEYPPQKELVSFQQEHKYHEDAPQGHKEEHKITEEQKQINNEYYTYYQKDVRHHKYAAEKEPTQTQQNYEYSSRPAEETEQKVSSAEQAENQEQEYKQSEKSQLEQGNSQKAQVYEKEYEKAPAYEKEYGNVPVYEKEYGKAPAYEKEYGKAQTYEKEYGNVPVYEKEYGKAPAYEKEYGKATAYEKEYGKAPAYEKEYEKAQTYEKEYGKAPAYLKEYGKEQTYEKEYEKVPAYEKAYVNEKDYGKAQTYEKVYEKGYEKEPVTRSYQIYEDQTEAYDPSQQLVADNKYPNKYIYKPVQQYQEGVKENGEESQNAKETANENINEQENEERIRVSASTEIPKAEIMKQIEKSVIKYMKELEAEGRIVTTSANPEPEPYFKVETITPSTNVKRKANKPLKQATSNNERPQDNPATAANKKFTKKSQSQEEETDNSYQSPIQQVDAVLTPNVEFIYKIKTQAPLHEATVKTVSKPYNLALKSYEEFDHSKALKNLQEFDLTHVVTTPAANEATQNSKANKLYFNSEIYHDIKAKTLKQKPSREQQEYQPEYETYAASKSQGGYYAEPPSEREASSSNISEDGYPLMNPYQFVSKKEAVPPRKQDDSYANYEPQQQHQSQQTKLHKYSALEYDSYNPKFNNNPEGYGYQQTYKSQLPIRPSTSAKRGKRGGGSIHGSHKKSTQRVNYTDLEANVALRPPPKQ